MSSKNADELLAVGPVDLVGRKAEATLTKGYSPLELARSGLARELGIPIDLARTSGVGANVLPYAGSWHRDKVDPRRTSPTGPVSIEVIASLNPDVLIFQSPGMRQVVAQSSQWRALRAVREHRAYVMPDQPFGWLGGPPSINNRLLAVAALSSDGSGSAVSVATFYAVVYGRTPKNEQMNALREGLQPLSP
jgi:iron complex transport system substrate-binding protein